VVDAALSSAHLGVHRLIRATTTVDPNRGTGPTNGAEMAARVKT
jgi:hypothetical protein